MSKRNIRRIELDCPIRYHAIGSDDIHEGRACDYSNSGVSFIARDKLEEGQLQEIHIDNPGEQMPPLHAIIEVIRCKPAEKPGEFFIAGFIKILK
ncbi:MAG: PilZ domain-containing protein [Gammaproteobacteria bacterium]|nr:PilZ domain-containing protein [Gammaproteobacteria bacterium]